MLACVDSQSRLLSAAAGCERRDNSTAANTALSVSSVALPLNLALFLISVCEKNHRSFARFVVRFLAATMISCRCTCKRRPIAFVRYRVTVRLARHRLRCSTNCSSCEAILRHNDDSRCGVRLCLYVLRWFATVAVESTAPIAYFSFRTLLVAHPNGSCCS